MPTRVSGDETRKSLSVLISVYTCAFTNEQEILSGQSKGETMPPRKRPARGGAAAETRRYEEELSSLSPEEIRRELQDMAESPGPIDSSNK